MNALTILDNDSLPGVADFEQTLIQFDQIAWFDSTVFYYGGWFVMRNSLVEYREKTQ